MYFYLGKGGVSTVTFGMHIRVGPPSKSNPPFPGVMMCSLLDESRSTSKQLQVMSFTNTESCWKMSSQSFH